MEASLQFEKLAVNVPNAHFQVDWNATTTKLLANPQKGFAPRQQIRESPPVL